MTTNSTNEIKSTFMLATYNYQVNYKWISDQ